MKILKIKFKNIHSLKGEKKIDFTKRPLSETGIFAIVGPTGSGKSTILDVIMLALYGQMPRIDANISKSTIENFGAVITRNTDDAYAEVEYETRNKIYRSKWSIRRNRNGNLNDYDMEIAEISNAKGKLIETYKSKVPAKNEEIIGLKYDQFLKSIILAQGSFSKFLKAKPEERTKMLEKITGSEIYRTIGQRAFEIAKKHKDKYETKQQIIENFDVLSDEKRKELLDEKSKTVEKIEFQSKKLKELTDKIKVKTNIVKLTEQLNILQNNLIKVEKEISDFEPNTEKLKLHEKLINLKADLVEHKNLRKSIDEFLFTLEENSKKKEKLEVIKNETLEKIKISTSKLDNLQENYEKNSPLINKYREIKSKLEVTSNEHGLLSKNLKSTKAELSSLNTQNQNLIKTKNKLENKLENTKKWLSENDILQELANDYIKIELVMQNYAESKAKTTEIINKSEFCDDFSRGNWGNYQQLSQQIFEKIKDEIINLENKIDNKETIEELKNNIDKIILEQPIIEKQIELSEKFQLIKNKECKLTSEIDNLLKTIEDNLQYEQKVKNEIEITTKLIEELQNRYEKEQLEAKYEHDRLRLEENAECPLCGSTSHPFVKQNKIVIIDKTKTELKKAEQDKSKFDKNLQKIISEISEKKSTVNALQKNLQEVENNLKNVEEIFSENNKKIDENFEFSKHNEIIELNIKTLDNKKRIQNKIQNLEKHEKAKHKFQIIENISEKISLVLDYHIQTRDLLQKYKNYYQGIKTPEKILEKLKKEYQNYNEKSKEIDNLQNDISSNIKFTEQNSQQIAVIQQKAEKETIRIHELADFLDKLQSNLTTISKDNFSGKTADDYQKTSSELIEKSMHIISELKNILTKTDTQIEEANHTIKELNLKIEKYKKMFSEKDKFLMSKLSEYNIESVEKALNALLKDEETEIIRQKQKKLYDAKTSVNQSIADTKKALEFELENEDNTRSLGELKIEAEQTEQQKQTFNQKVGSISTTLKNDDEQKGKLSSLKDEIENFKKEFERWEALNKLIGDKNGKKFSQIAHQFTLTELISISNKHLKRFTNRYLLDKTTESKNNLFVYDTYMGMTKRSVQTLSGGETFLVSLSMALALSDLASRKTKIESLFIDEGFGTLDEQTLDKALVNLEKLHTDYNRTIGLISHVPEIKERISTKIVVKKMNSGYSDIEIL